ncbi:MAG: hypothetical protein JO129_03920, partial [Candidatus Dependentiae bacterium]|nr:hypothetical protein [Candidatus Dependentiae bacterium]
KLFPETFGDQLVSKASLASDTGTAPLTTSQALANSFTAPSSTTAITPLIHSLLPIKV